MLLFNPVIISIIVLLFLSLLRVNVVLGLVLSALTAGIVGHLGITHTINTFVDGLGGGAQVAMNYAILGAFAVAISRSGVTDMLAYKVIRYISKRPTGKSVIYLKYVLMAILLIFAIASQNAIPVHIAFIPIIVPPLIAIFNHLKLDRRAVACVLTFGLTATYMWLPVGFGKIFMESILVKNINLAGASYGLKTNVSQVSLAMTIPVLGMLLGLLIAVFFSYRKPRYYRSSIEAPSLAEIDRHINNIKKSHIVVAFVAILVTFSLQLMTSSTIIAGVAGLVIFGLGGIFKLKESNNIFHEGLTLMAMIGFVMIAASGFATVINATNAVPTLIATLTQNAHSKGLSAFFMLIIGLFITMGIGSSFSTVPIIASIYVPLCINLDFSPIATVVIVGVSAALGDAGSPASDSTLGPTSGLNIDGRHDHIWDTVVPTFIHYNIPLLVFGWLAAMTL